MSKQHLPDVPDFRPGQQQIPARSLNALRDAGLASMREGEPGSIIRPRQLVVKLKEAISAEAKGDVVQVYWDDDASAFVEFGPEFEAVNMGPVDATEDAIVSLTMGQAGLFMFQSFVAAATGFIGFKHIIRADMNGGSFTFSPAANGVLIPFDRVRVNVGGGWDTTNFQFKVPSGSAGKYLFYCQVRTTSMDSTDIEILTLSLHLPGRFSTPWSRSQFKWDTTIHTHTKTLVTHGITGDLSVNNVIAPTVKSETDDMTISGLAEMSFIEIMGPLPEDT